MKEYLVIAKTIKPQGIGGEIKLLPSVDDYKDLKRLKTVYIDDISYSVMNWRITGDSAYFNLRGVGDRTAAESFRGKTVLCKRADFPLPEGRVFIADIIGSDVCLSTNGVPFAKVTDITAARTDIYTLETSDGKILRFPAVEGVITSIDAAEGKIIVDSARFDEVAVYED